MTAEPFKSNVTWAEYFANAGDVVRRFLGALWLILAIALAMALVSAGEGEYDGTCSSAQLAVDGC